MKQPSPLASVIIAAHNEGPVIRRCLSMLLAGATADELDVIVVANACADDTAEQARRAGARVLETSIKGKAHAIRLGDDAAQAFPRLYLDADVVVDTASVRALVRELADTDVLACAPAPVLELADVGPVARRVHRVHDLMVGPQRVLAGAGLYAVGAEGHARAFPLPDVIADDEWVHRSFAPHERRVVQVARTVVRPAPTVLAHLRRRARVRYGNDELRRMGRPRTDMPIRLGRLGELVRQGSIGRVDALCYLTVTAGDRAASTIRRARRRTITWSSDTGSRHADGFGSRV